jgi:hypothetical protein
VKHYVDSAYSQVRHSPMLVVLSAIFVQSFNVLLSLKMLGNPLNALSSLKEGIEDLIHEPVNGLVESPEAFGMGVVSGSLSATSKAVSAVLGTAASVTGFLYS